MLVALQSCWKCSGGPLDPAGMTNSVLTAFPTPHCWACGPESSPIPTLTQSSQLIFALLSTLLSNQNELATSHFQGQHGLCTSMCLSLLSVWDSSTSTTPPFARGLALCLSPIPTVVPGSLLPSLLPHCLVLTYTGALIHSNFWSTCLYLVSPIHCGFSNNLAWALDPS